MTRESGKSPERLSRRGFFRAALAIGGTNALTACMELERGGDTPDLPQGPTELEDLPDRQFAWNDYLVRDPHGNTVTPRHQVILFLEYVGPVPPTDRERERVEGLLRTLERAYQRGRGDDSSAINHRGLLFMIGYSNGYFSRFDTELSHTVDLPSSRALLDALDEEGPSPDEHDALLLLTSDYVSALLEVEEALFGERGSMNGIRMEDDLKGIFERADRRTGVLGKGLPRERLRNDDIPEDAPLSMGYKSGLRDNQATEDRVTISSGPFSQGTTLQVSKLRIDLDSWYSKDGETRAHLMFSPEHSAADVGDIAEQLAGDSEITPEIADKADEHAEKRGIVGHSQKLARARDEEFKPRILRRSESVNTDPVAGAAMNFVSIQRRMADFVETRRAMTGRDLPDVDCPHHGILDDIDVLRRATYLIPPREKRSLPHPAGE